MATTSDVLVVPSAAAAASSPVSVADAAALLDRNPRVDDPLTDEKKHAAPPQTSPPPPPPPSPLPSPEREDTPPPSSSEPQPPAIVERDDGDDEHDESSGAPPIENGDGDDNDVDEATAIVGVEASVQTAVEGPPPSSSNDAAAQTTPVTTMTAAVQYDAKEEWLHLPQTDDDNRSVSSHRNSVADLMSKTRSTVVSARQLFAAHLERRMQQKQPQGEDNNNGGGGGGGGAGEGEGSGGADTSSSSPGEGGATAPRAGASTHGSADKALVEQQSVQADLDEARRETNELRAMLNSERYQHQRQVEELQRQKDQVELELSVVNLEMQRKDSVERYVDQIRETAEEEKEAEENDDENDGPSTATSEVHRLKAQLCKSMHQTHILEDRLAVVKKSSDAVIESLNQDLIEIVSERNQLEARYLNELALVNRESQQTSQEYETKVTSQREEYQGQIDAQKLTITKLHNMLDGDVQRAVIEQLDRALNACSKRADLLERKYKRLVEKQQQKSEDEKEDEKRQEGSKPGEAGTTSHEVEAPATEKKDREGRTLEEVVETPNGAIVYERAEEDGGSSTPQQPQSMSVREAGGVDDGNGDDEEEEDSVDKVCTMLFGSVRKDGGAEGKNSPDGDDEAAAATSAGGRNDDNDVVPLPRASPAPAAPADARAGEGGNASTDDGGSVREEQVDGGEASVVLNTAATSVAAKADDDDSGASLNVAPVSSSTASDCADENKDEASPMHRESRRREEAGDASEYVSPSPAGCGVDESSAKEEANCHDTTETGTDEQHGANNSSAIGVCANEKGKPSSKNQKSLRDGPSGSDELTDDVTRACPLPDGGVHDEVTSTNDEPSSQIQMATDTNDGNDGSASYKPTCSVVTEKVGEASAKHADSLCDEQDAGDEVDGVVCPSHDGNVPEEVRSASGEPISQNTVAKVAEGEDDDEDNDDEDNDNEDEESEQYDEAFAASDSSSVATGDGEASWEDSNGGGEIDRICSSHDGSVYEEEQSANNESGSLNLKGNNGTEGGDKGSRRNPESSSTPTRPARVCVDDDRTPWESDVPLEWTEQRANIQALEDDTPNNVHGLEKPANVQNEMNVSQESEVNPGRSTVKREAPTSTDDKTKDFDVSEATKKDDSDGRSLHSKSDRFSDETAFAFFPTSAPEDFAEFSDLAALAPKRSSAQVARKRDNAESSELTPKAPNPSSTRQVIKTRKKEGKRRHFFSARCFHRKSREDYEDF